MNKKVFGLFAIFLVVVLAAGAVSAANLSNHDFDGYFSMKAPNDVSFQKQDDSVTEGDFKAVSIAYIADDLAIFYADSTASSEYSSYYLYQGTFQSLNPDLTKCYESQEDNLRILEPTTSDSTHFALVGTSLGNKTIMLMGSDVGLLKEMAHSIEFE